MKSLIIGKGQIGQALFEIFSKVHECYIRDIRAELDDPKSIEVLHLAYPDSENFVESVLDYKAYYKPRLTIIHSSVAIGTTQQCGEHVVHSPERGRFPNLAREMRMYRKFIGFEEIEDGDLAAFYINACNWPTQLVDDPQQTEMLKLLSNAHMGLEIAWRQEVERLGVNAEIYQLWEQSYQTGYMKTNQHHLIRPIMRPDPIGGHCILPCIDLLLQRFASKFLELIKESNGLAKRKEESASYHASAVSSR